MTWSCGVYSSRFTGRLECTTKSLCWRHKPMMPMRYERYCSIQQTNDCEGDVRSGWIPSSSSSSSSSSVTHLATVMTPFDESTTRCVFVVFSRYQLASERKVHNGCVLFQLVQVTLSNLRKCSDRSDKSAKKNGKCRCTRYHTTNVYQSKGKNNYNND